MQPSELHIQTILNNILDGIITIDERGIIQSVNHATEDIFGYLAKELVGQNVKMLMPESYQHQHDDYIRNHLQTGEKKIIGIGREVVGKRKDGSTFPMDLGVNEVIVKGSRFFTGIVRDVTARKAAELAKSEFISTVSHELRTPLTSIRGALGLIAGGAVGEIPAQAQVMLDIALKNSERLVNLINDILDIEKIESGKMAFDLKVQKLMPLVEQAIEANRAYGDQYGVTFMLKETLPDALVNVDADRLQQVLANLLSNAAKFSDGSALVEISVSQHGENVRVTVTDYGIGIPEELRNQVFERFTQADSSSHRQQGGTGLGLSIAKAIVERLGGQIGVETEVGKGSRFYFELPCLAIHESEMSAATETESVEPRILVCEDDPSVAEVLSAMLARAGYHTDRAFSAQQAKEMLQQREYAAMTLDILLPDQNGLLLLRDLQMDHNTQGLPIVIVSATARDDLDQLEGQAIGVLDWLQKPIDPKRLIATIEHAVVSQEERDIRILHIEDDPDVTRVVSAVLQDIAEIIHACDAQSARDVLQKSDFDLIILDLSLPDEDGLMLLPVIQQCQPSVPVLVFSAQDLTAESAQDVAACLVKSRTSNQEFLTTIRNLIYGRVPITRANHARGI